MPEQPVEEEQRFQCPVCEQHVTEYGYGPWCVLYITNRFCPPLIAARRRIRQADGWGDGPFVNAWCQDIRSKTCDEFVP